ncbi:MAG: hypothetical protein MI802_00320 [Desulfobacterales bacterium]|nr:hypothetical protein [Desulfobacterales bacterium]
MIDLIFSILSCTAILVLFKSFERREIPIFHTIIINYVVAFGLGIAVNHGTGSLDLLTLFREPWIGIAAGLGVGLIVMFFMIGLSTQRAGIMVTTVAGRISVVIPMLFSIFYYGEPVTRIKVAGICLALAALVCSVIRPVDNKKTDPSSWYLPLVLFIGLGVLDTLVKFVQHEYVSDAASAAFTGASFFFAFCAGGLICLVRKEPFSGFVVPRVAVAGILLGTVNFGSIYFLINALNSGIFDSAVLFAVNSISIVALSVFCGTILFRERLSMLNLAGVIMAGSAIILFVQA